MAGKKDRIKHKKRRKEEATYALPKNYNAIQQKLEDVIENGENTKNGKGWKLGLGGRKRKTFS